jgi:lipopolysaccharide assembly outer membrane protein LptD (OstA)
VLLKDGTTTTAAELLASDPAAFADGSLDNFPLGPEGDGVFQEGELLNDRGHRIFLNPRLSYPMRLWDAVEVNPEIGYHGTLYQSEERSFESRNLFSAQVDVRTRLRRSLALPFGMGNTLHVLEPHVKWTALTDTSQEDNPLFTPQGDPLQQRLRELALFSVTRDTADRLDAVNAFTFGFGNRFYIPKEDAEGTRLFADVDFALQYDFENDGFTGVYIDGSAWPHRRIRSRFNVGYDFNAGELSEGLLAVSWSHEEGHDLGMAYRYVAQSPRFFEAFTFDDERFEDFEQGITKINQIFLFARWAITRHWALSYRMQYSFEESFFLGNEAAVEYLSRCRCWAVRLEVSDERTRGVEVNLRYRLIGLGDDTVRPFESRGRRDRGDRFEEEEL